MISGVGFPILFWWLNMATSQQIYNAKMALRITTDAFDGEISMLIDAAEQDLQVAGVVLPESLTAIVGLAINTYVKMHFGEPDEYDRLKKSYDEQKAQLSTCTGYTNWGGA